jgi:hypothetical protein
MELPHFSFVEIRVNLLPSAFIRVPYRNRQFSQLCSPVSPAR